MIYPGASQELLLPCGCSISLRHSWAQMQHLAAATATADIIAASLCLWGWHTQDAANKKGCITTQEVKVWCKGNLNPVFWDSSSTKPSLLLQNPEEKLVSQWEEDFVNTPDPRVHLFRHLILNFQRNHLYWITGHHYFLSLSDSPLYYYTFQISVWVLHTNLHRATHIAKTECDLSFCEENCEMH